MNLNGTDQPELQVTVEALRAELSRLGDRLAAVERQFLLPTAAPPPSAPADDQPAVSDETVIHIITAAVAAFLGIKPHIRQIRLVGGASWAEQGRVSIQASHAIPVRHE